MLLVYHIENTHQLMERTKLFEIKLSGLNLKKEIEYLSDIRDNPIKPFILLIGGIKIKDKIGTLENLLPKADKVLLGGGTAFTFLKSSGIPVGNSPVENEYLSWALTHFQVPG